MYSIIIPVYNGEKTIELLLKKILAAMHNVQESIEVIFVHDCGFDRSKEVMANLKEAYPEIVKTLYLTRNYGQHNALIAGVAIAKGELIITLDEDLQHDPKDFEKLIETQKLGDFDVVYGTCMSLEHSSFRNFTSNLMKKILSIAIKDLHHDYSAFRIIKRDIAKKMTKMRNSYTFLDGYLSWITTNISSVEVTHNKRIAGESAYSMKKLIHHSLNIIFTFSNLPVRLLSISSILIFIITLCYTIYIVIRKIVLNDLAVGFPTIIISIGLGISLILLGISILGEYLFRVNLKTTKRPNYIVRNEK